MKNIILTLVLLLIQIFVYAQPQLVHEPEQKYYCVQILCTQTPHLLSKSKIDITGRPILVEEVLATNNTKTYRILSLYLTKEEANQALNMISQLGYVSTSTILVRTHSQVEKMYSLFYNNEMRS